MLRVHMCRDGGGSSNELSRIFSQRKEHSELCQREAAEECRRYTELALQQQRAAMEKQYRQSSANQYLAGAPC